MSTVPYRTCTGSWPLRPRLLLSLFEMDLLKLPGTLTYHLDFLSEYGMSLSANPKPTKKTKSRKLFGSALTRTSDPDPNPLIYFNAAPDPGFAVTLELLFFTFLLSIL